MLRRLLPLLLFCLCSQADAAAYWTRGVTPQSGWFDADKVLPADRNKCWAASASNLVAWWQAQNPEASAQTQAPQGLDKVWETLKNSFDDISGDTYSAVRWWFNGDTPPKPMPPNAYGATQGAYCKELITAAERPFPGQDVLLESPKENMSRRIKELLEGGYALGIGIRRIDKNFTIIPAWHMLSLWGIEYDEEKELITRVYLTDSDDIAGEWPKYQRGIFAAEAVLHDVTDEKGETRPGLILYNKVGWFKANCTITTLVGLHADTGKR